MFVLEPDGLPQMTDCLNAERRAERTEMIRYAIDKLMATPGGAVYVDAGHSAWVPAPEMAARLKEAGIDRADGFSINVSNYQTTKDSLTYGRALSALLGGKHFIVDTGRNGNGPPTASRPRTRAAGATPTDARSGFRRPPTRRAPLRRLLLGEAPRRVRRPLQPRPRRRHVVAPEGAGDGPQREVVAAKGSHAVAGATGTANQNVAPCPASLSIPISPPCAWTTLFAI